MCIHIHNFIQLQHAQSFGMAYFLENFNVTILI